MPYLLAALGIYLVDQASKTWAVRVLRDGADKDVVDGFLTFAYAENRGIAFSLLQEGGNTGRWLLVALAVVAAVGVLIFLARNGSSHAWRVRVIACRHHWQSDGSRQTRLRRRFY